MNDIKTIKLTSGSELRFKYCSFGDFQRLKSVVLHHLGLRLDDKTMEKLSAGEFGTIGDLFDKNKKVLVSFLVELMADREFEEMALKCASPCLLNGERIGEGTFERVENRVDYFDVLVNVIRENIAIFFSDRRNSTRPSSKFLKTEKKPTAWAMTTTSTTCSFFC